MTKVDMKRLLYSTVALLSFVVLLLIPFRANAATVSMNYQLSSSSVTEGSNVVVSVFLDLGSAQTLDALVTVNFDSSKLQYVSAQYPSWGSSGPEDGLSGASYRVDILANSEQTGNVKMVDLTFRALASSGSSSLTMSSASVSDSSVPPPAEHTVNTSSATVNFQAKPAPVTTTPTSPSSPSNGSGSSGDSGSSSSSANQGEPAQNQSSAEPLPTEEEIQTNAQLDDDEPVPISIDNVVDNASYFVAIEVRNEEGNVVANTPVTIGDQTVDTNDNGIAEFAGLRAGTYTVEYLGQSTEISVQPGDPLIGQEFAVTQNEESTNILVVLGVVLVGLFIVAVLLVLIKRFFDNRGPRGKNMVMPGAETTAEQKEEHQETIAELELKVRKGTPPPSPETVVTPNSIDKTE